MNSVLKVVKSALKLLILGWVVAGENQLVRSGDEDQTRVRFSYFIKATSKQVGPTALQLGKSSFLALQSP
jgi:hypothetical protein